MKNKPGRPVGKVNRSKALFATITKRQYEELEKEAKIRDLTIPKLLNKLIVAFVNADVDF